MLRVNIYNPYTPWITDSSLWIPDSAPWIPDSTNWIPDSRSVVDSGFHKNWPRIRISDSSDVWILDSTVKIPDCKAIKSRILF